MNCPNCGNEVGPDEVFCGQCGTPNIPPAQPAETVQTRPVRSGLLSDGYHTQVPSSETAANPGVQRPPYPTGQLSPSQSALRPQGPGQQGDFYQEATEAMSALPNSGLNLPPRYPQQGFTGTGMRSGYPVAGPYGPQMQPFQAGGQPGPAFPQTPSFYTGQGYGMPPRLTPPPQKQQNGAVLIIAIICLAFAIIAATAFGALYLLRNNPAKSHNTPAATPTPAVTVTTIPSPSPTATDTPSPTPTPSPSPSPTATPADPGFTLCDTACTSNGFSVEYPSGWQQAITKDSTGTQFSDPAQPDIFAAFKTPGVASTTADTLVNTDLSNNFPGSTASPSSSNATIGGETWVYTIATYQLNGQSEQVEVYATVHQSKAYIIELEAPAAQFAAVNTQYFEVMLNRFQFQ